MVAVAQAHVKVRRRLAEAGDEEPVDLADHGALERSEVVGRDAGRGALAQTLGGAAQIAREVGVHLGGVARAGGLGHGLLRTDAVLLDEALEHVPLTAVADGVGQQVGNEPTVERLVERVENVLEEPVALLEFVPKERVGLAELKGLEVVALDDAVAHGVEAGKHPAAAGAPLVAALALLDLDVKRERVGGHALRHARSGADARGGHGVFGDGVGAVGEELIAGERDVVCGNRLRRRHGQSFLDWVRRVPGTILSRWRAACGQAERCLLPNEYAEGKGLVASARRTPLPSELTREIVLQLTYALTDGFITGLVSQESTANTCAVNSAVNQSASA